MNFSSILLPTTYTDFVFSCIYDIVRGDMKVQLSSYDFFGHILHNYTQLSRSLKSHTQSLYTKCTLKDLINCKFSFLFKSFECLSTVFPYAQLGMSNVEVQEIRSSQRFVMLTRLVSCFCLVDSICWSSSVSNSLFLSLVLLWAHKNVSGGCHIRLTFELDIFY